MQILKNMGPQYVGFRIWFELQKKTGLLKRKYPVNPIVRKLIDLDDWKKLDIKFFFESKETLIIPRDRNDELKAEVDGILKGEFTFFSASKFTLGKNYDWITNPDTGFKYNIHKHWVDINDYSKEAGDIKYVWEKSRFTYLNTVIRYDYHFEEDLSEFVFTEIEDWINKNPINCGPNYKCSQEISLRSFNWIFALHYYKNSPALTTQRFEQIMHVLYWQAKHVFNNINFSRIAVRNNHAITECLGIYIFGLMFPFLPESEQWKRAGKKWLEEEVAYQIYEDGTFLQFSMNYHRVVIQLLTWAIQINRLNDKPFKDIIYKRAIASTKFLNACMNEENGMLPNYGANDGALFFKLSNQSFRDYRPQLEVLSICLEQNWDKSNFEDKFWYGLKQKPVASIARVENTKWVKSNINRFDQGGYYTIRDTNNSLTFIRCGNHKDRPSQADNLHLDIWVAGENILRDAGSYKYNTDESNIRYFLGSQSHNTVTLGSNDQMLKGNRFIWYYWTQCKGASIAEFEDSFLFTGEITAFTFLEKDIRHKRTVLKKKEKLYWEIKDEVLHNTGIPIKQYWHPNPSFFDRFEIRAKDIAGNEITAQYETGYYSGLYGIKEEVKQLVFTSKTKEITTTISEIQGHKKA